MDANDLRTALRTAAVGVTGGSYTMTDARCVLGLDMQSNSNTLLSTMSSAGPYLIIHPAALVSDGQISGGPKEYDIGCTLYIGFDRESDQTWTAEETLVEALRAAWVAVSAISVTWSAPRFDFRDAPGIGAYDLSVTMFGCG